ncbi:uncharacterized protein LOC126708519 [Quercus robur]|uniref:uncharacterized protein LOC126708519 n=1 Tax=Quercus robur TaxID=38942 RepID=UPI002161B264|nr:uncharacterized protein LOC126708519 [Quercus robur]
MSSPETAERMALWAMELSEFDIQYRPRTAIKGQVVVDFIAEFTLGDGQGAEEMRQWNIYANGSSNRRAGGAGVVIQTPEGDKIECMIRLDFPTTNNEAEYEALVAGLDLAKVASAENMVVHCDSQVVTSQINGGYECKNERMKRYLEEVKNRIGSHEVRFVQIPRKENECADRLAKATLAEFMLVPEQVLSFVQISSLIDDGTNVQEVDSESNWTTPLISYLKTGVLPDENDAARKLKVQATRVMLIKDVLYKIGFSRSYLRCLSHEEANYVMREVHEGICKNHSGARSLVHKLIRAGYYWSTMLKDAQAYVKACDKCQRFSNLIRQPSKELTPMTAPWPFTQWGLDIMGPFPTAVRYGIPRVLVSDNGKQFDNSAFRDFCSELGIKNHYSSPAHPQANGQAEVTNQSLLKIVKTQLKRAKAEVGLTSYQVENYDEDKNEEAMRLQLDLVDEVRVTAEQRMARYQNLMGKHYNSNVRHRDFQAGDLVLRKGRLQDKDAEEQQDRNHQVRDWLKKLRDAVYGEDDLLSDFSTEDLRRRVMGGDKMAKKQEEKSLYFTIHGSKDTLRGDLKIE